MSKIKPLYNRFQVLRELGDELIILDKKHRANAPTGIPVGGGDWMDTFFKIEGVSEIIKTLRVQSSTTVALRKGKEASSEAVKRWNNRREYQVHRWEKTAYSYLEGLMRRVTNNNVRID